MRPPTLSGSPSRMPASSSRSTGKARSIATGPLPSSASNWSASSSSPSQPRCRRPTTRSRASSAAPSTPCITAATTPSPASCSESSSAPTPRSSSTTARPSPRYTAARRAKRRSFDSISLRVVLRYQAQPVAHHRRESRRLASASPASCARAGSVEVTGADVQTPQYAETPRPSHPSPAPTLAAQLESEDPAATHLSAFSDVDAGASGPLFCRFSEAPPPGRCARSGKRGAASRRSSVSSRRL
jgi:hypothetical protein